MNTLRNIIQISTKFYAKKFLLPWTIFVLFSVMLRIIEGRSDYERMFYISIVSYPIIYISFIFMMTVIIILTMIFKGKNFNEVATEMNRNI